MSLILWTKDQMIAITLDVYSHVTPAMHREAARVMDELLAT